MLYFTWSHGGNSTFLINFLYCFKFHFIKIFPYKLELKLWGFPGGAVVENLPANAGDTGSSPGLGGSHMPRSD